VYRTGIALPSVNAELEILMAFVGTCSLGLLDVEASSEGALLEGVPALVPVCWLDEVWLALLDCVVEGDVELEPPHPATASPSTSTPLTVILTSSPIVAPS
jgi:hypothetical protein